MHYESTIHKNHISLKSENDIRKIASPLLDNSPIEFFYYGRNYHDGAAFRLTTNSKYFETWLKNNHAWSPSFLKQGWHMWDDSMPADQIKIREDEFGYGNGLYFINHTKEYTEIFGYAPKLYDCMTSFILNEKDVLERFNLYFKERASKIIAKAENDALHCINKRNVPTCREPRFSLDKEELISAMPIKTMKFSRELEVSLSEKELIAFHAVLIGHTAKELSSKLAVSQKTAETYVYRVKKKFKCKTRSELIGLSRDLGFINVSGWLN